jgi:hypothetical protein
MFIWCDNADNNNDDVYADDDYVVLR